MAEVQPWLVLDVRWSRMHLRTPQVHLVRAVAMARMELLERAESMIVTRDRLRCGNCGEGTFTLEHARPLNEVRAGGEGAGGFQGPIMVICVECGEESELAAIPAALHIEGVLCGGWANITKEKSRAKKEG